MCLLTQSTLGLIVAGCPAGDALNAGQCFGYAIAWSLGDTPGLAGSHTDARYPQQAWLWEPPADQRGDGGITSATGFGWGVALSRQSIVFGGPLTKQVSLKSLFFILSYASVEWTKRLSR